MMSGCTDVRELLSLYLEGELEEEQAVMVGEHLAVCEDCAGIVETLEGIVDAGSALDELEPPDHLLSDLASSPCTGGWASFSRRWTARFRSTISNGSSPTSRPARRVAAPGRT